MEIVEGEDLAKRLKHGAIPIDEAIAIAKQIADGLGEAHERGIIHRDRKPANVKVTPDGKVKLLDFGLAKALEGEAGTNSGSSQLSHSPTMSRHAAVRIQTNGRSLEIGPRRLLFGGRAITQREGVIDFSLARQKFLFARADGAAPPPKLVLVSDWRAGLGDQPKP